MIKFNMDVAVNNIASLEQTIPTITTSYAFGADPNDLTNVSLPAIVHVETGPVNATGGQGGRLTMGGQYAYHFEIESRALLIKAVPNEPLSVAKKMYNDVWFSILEVFMADPNIRQTILPGTNALDYSLIFPDPSFARTGWPIASRGYETYWTFRYAHRFRIVG